MPAKPSRITFFNQTFALGGAETLYHDLFFWLKQHGVEVEVYTTFPPLAQKLNFLARVHHFPFAIDLIGDWKGFLKGLFFLPLGFFYYGILVAAHRQTDLIFVSGVTEKILVTFWARIFGLPVVWLEHGPLSRLLQKFGGFSRRLYLSVSSYPYKIITPSRFTAADLVKNLGISPTRIEIIPNGVNIATSPSAPVPYRVCCVSRLEPGKGQDLLIQAWPGVISHVPQARLCLVGAGDFRPRLESLASSLNLSAVEFTGWVPDAGAYQAASQICVFPTLWPLEGFGMAGVEAMAHSKPVIGFNFGPLPEIITPATGILVPPGDVAALARAIVSLLKNPFLSRRLGNAGRQRYLAKYTISVMGPRYLKVFSRVC